MELSAYINFKENTEYQAIYTSQLYGTFFVIYAKFNTDFTSDTENYYLLEADLKIINYKGLLDIGITRAQFEAIQDDNSNDIGGKFKIEVKALHKSSKTDLKVTNIDPKQKFPKVKSYLLVDRRVRPIHLKGFEGKLRDSKDKNYIAIQNGIFDTEFFYRDGVISNIEDYKEVSPKPDEWDENVIFNIGLAGTRCPRSKITIKN